MSNEAQPERSPVESVLPSVVPDPAAVVFSIGHGSYIDGHGNIYNSLDAARGIAAVRGLTAEYPRVIELNRFQPAVADFLRHDPREQLPVPLAQVQQEPPTQNPVTPPWAPRRNPSIATTTYTIDTTDTGDDLVIRVGCRQLVDMYNTYSNHMGRIADMTYESSDSRMLPVIVRRMQEREGLGEWTPLQRFLLNMMGVPTQIQPGQVQPPIAEQMVLPVQRRRHERLIQIDQPDPEKADA